MKKFPVGTYFYEFNCGDNLLKDSFNTVKQLEKEEKLVWSSVKGTNDPANYAYFDKECTIPFFQEPLFRWFDECLEKVAEDSFPGVNLTICDSWLTKMTFGQSAPGIHHHQNSIYSGVFYYTSHQNSPTHFYINNKGFELYSKIVYFGKPGYDYFDSKNFQHKFESRPEAGKLLIFPSDITHNIPIHNDIKNKRYTLAFNTFISGELPGGKSARLHVKTKSVAERYEEWVKNSEI